MSITSRTRTVQIADLKVPTEYHKGVNPPVVERLTSSIEVDPHPELLKNVAISSRPDGLYVVDGVQRVAALKALGVEEMEATVLTGLDLADEQELFRQRNIGTRVS